MKRSPIRSKPSPNTATPQQRLWLGQRSGWRCERCASPGVESWHAHHRQLRQSGNNGLENFAVLCSPCHDLVHSRRLKVGEPGGWIVSRYADPAAVPIAHFHRGPTWLTSDGSYSLAAPVGVPVDGPNDPSSALSVTVSLDQDRRSEQQ